ncbi:MAG: peptidase S58 family protein [Dehalococcoidia bacterium]|nr:peptidase S58 family protein [Dehalococcoidia bacterium]
MSSLIEGFRIGQVSDLEAGTGVTVLLCEEGAVPGVDVRGGAPGTRETDLLRPEGTVDRAHAIVLAGGSAFGLAAADGVVRWLEERGIGWPTVAAKVPIVASAILYDLNLGRPDVRPDAAMAYRACDLATNKRPASGVAGAGTGATLAKLLGPERALKGGLGFAEDRLDSGIVVQAVMAVNAIGSVVDPASGEVVAAPRGERPGSFEDSLDLLRRGAVLKASKTIAANTVIGIVMTNAALTKQEATRVAIMAQNGISRTVIPAQTTGDGDTVFVMAHGDIEVEQGALSAVGAIAAAAVEAAVLDAARSATGLHGLPSASEWRARAT